MVTGTLRRGITLYRGRYRVRIDVDGVTQWLEDLDANPDRSPSTVLSYRSVLRNHVLPELGSTRLRSRRWRRRCRSTDRPVSCSPPGARYGWVRCWG